METFERNVIYLSVEEITQRNKEMILKTGGCRAAAGIPLNYNSLEYLVRVVEEGIAGHQFYSNLSQKAAAYAFNIITRHIFVDGNKRTGMSCSFYFLELNGYNVNVTDDEIEVAAKRIAESNMDFHQLVTWFEEKIQPLQPILLSVQSGFNSFYNPFFKSMDLNPFLEAETGPIPLKETVAFLGDIISPVAPEDWEALK
jgi:death-on-curing protein